MSTIKSKSLEEHVEKTFAPELLEIAKNQQPIKNVSEYGKFIWGVTLDYQKLIATAEDETMKTYYIAQYYRIVHMVTCWGVANGIY